MGAEHCPTVSQRVTGRWDPDSQASRESIEKPSSITFTAALYLPGDLCSFWILNKYPLFSIPGFPILEFILQPRLL